MPQIRHGCSANEVVHTYLQVRFSSFSESYPTIAGLKYRVMIQSVPTHDRAEKSWAGDMPCMSTHMPDSYAMCMNKTSAKAVVYGYLS